MERDCLDLNFIIRLQARGEVVDLNIMIYTDAVGDRRKEPEPEVRERMYNVHFSQTATTCSSCVILASHHG